MRCCSRCAETPRWRSWPSPPATPGPRSSPTSTRSTSPPATPSRSWRSASAPTWWSIGPEVPLVLGVADAVRAAGIACFGPTKDASRIEGSKSFAKEVMTAAGVRTATSEIVDNPRAPRRGARPVRAVRRRPAWVVKDDGLAAGKGVVVTADRDTARAHAASLLDAGHPVLLESFLDGPEVSLFCVVDGETVVPLLPAQDFKRVGDNDTGPEHRRHGRLRTAAVAARRGGRADRRRRRETRCGRNGSAGQSILRSALRGAGDHVAGSRGGRIQLPLRRS